MLLRIGMVEDHPATLLGTAAIVNMQSDMLVVASASGVEELLKISRDIDIVLLDLVLPGPTPSSNIRRLHNAGCKVIVYTSGECPELIREAARSGVEGLVRKTAEAAAVAEAIRAVANGDVAASADWAAALDADDDFVSAGLSAREAEVLSLYAAGATAEDVATTLFLSKATVHDYIRRIRAKYAAVDRPAPSKVDLLRRAIEDGFLSS